MNLTAIEIAQRDCAIRAMERVAHHFAGALLSEDGDSFLRRTHDAYALIEEWGMTAEMVAWAHDQASALIPED